VFARDCRLTWFAGDRLRCPDIGGQRTAGFGGRRSGDRFELGRQVPDQLRGGDRDFVEDKFGSHNGLADFRLTGLWRLDTGRLQRNQALQQGIECNLRLLKQTVLLVRLLAQTGNANGLANTQPEQRAQQRIAERLVEHPAQHQANQHENPLHGRYP